MVMKRLRFYLSGLGLIYNPILGWSRQVALHPNPTRMQHQLSVGQVDEYGCSDLYLLNSRCTSEQWLQWPNQGPRGPGTGVWIWHNCWICTLLPAPGHSACRIALLSPCYASSPPPSCLSQPRKAPTLVKLGQRGGGGVLPAPVFGAVVQTLLPASA